MCCETWMEHLRADGHIASMVEDEDLFGYKVAVGVPVALWSCHTAIVEAYAIEGHVPVAEINRLLAERPDTSAEQRTNEEARREDAARATR